MSELFHSLVKGRDNEKALYILGGIIETRESLTQGSSAEERDLTSRTNEVLKFW